MMRIGGVALLVVCLVTAGRSAPARAFDPSQAAPPDQFGGPEAGERSPTFVLTTLEGQPVTLAEALKSGPVVLEFGSYTCPVFRQQHGAMEALHAAYGDHATFLTVYTVEAHPQGDPSPYTGQEWVTNENRRSGILYRQPTTAAERRELADTMRDELAVRMPIIVDDMENSTWHAFGMAPNAAYLIGSDGRVKVRQGWFEPREFERALQREVGEPGG